MPHGTSSPVATVPMTRGAEDRSGGDDADGVEKEEGVVPALGSA